MTRHPARDPADRRQSQRRPHALARRDPARPRPGGPSTPQPDSLFADRGYNHETCRDQVHARGIVLAIARRGTRHGTGLSTYRCVIERSFAWLHGPRRLRIRWKRRADIHEAFLELTCCLIIHQQLSSLSEPLLLRRS
ncbi:transposase [Streptomyces sparsogenes]|uniref:transposase n=1 Tax=Streptomyces sparsogenes TaxID=67365 RepID=UPI003F4CD469